jgi:hypothetical protein
MKQDNFHIAWDLHELGPKPAPDKRPALHGPTDRAQRDFARALATGDIPANAPRLAEDEAA